MEPGSLHSILITSKKLKSLKNNKNNNSPCISKRGEDAEQKAARDESRRWTQAVMTRQSRLKNEAAAGADAVVGKQTAVDELLKAQWPTLRVNVMKNQLLVKGYPTILGDLLPGRWPGSHSKHWRKKPLRFLQKEGKRNNLEISQVTLFLIRPASGETNNQTYKRLYCWSLTEMAKGNRQFQPTWAILSHLNISKKIQKFLWSSHPRGNGWYLITGPQDTSTTPQNLISTLLKTCLKQFFVSSSHV